MRLFDLILSTIALCALSPLLLLCIIILKFTGEGEIFYVQDRVGRDNVSFGLIKFATMLKNSPNIGTGHITVENDPRILPFGHLLRKTKINELPQLINIFIGDMSIIGPRPLTRDNFNIYDDGVRKKIISVRPGLSGVGSIIFRDEERFLTTQVNAKNTYRDIIAPYKGELETWYIDRQSLNLYFALVFLTLPAVIFPRSFNLSFFYPSLPKPPEKLVELL